MEKYVGVKFDFVDDGDKINEKEIRKFLKIDNTLRRFLKTRENEGNLSIRTNNGFLIKHSGAKMTKLKKTDVVFVRRIIGMKVFCSGGTPSSESLMHHRVYKNSPAANIVLHFHYDKLLGKLKIKKVGPFPYGSIALAKSIGKAAKTNKIIEIANHGFVIVATNQNKLSASLESMVRR